MAFFSVIELIRWTGMSTFEMVIHLFGLIIFTILLTLKAENVIEWNWWLIFAPLFFAVGLNLYFTVIVFLRTYLESGEMKQAIARSLSLVILLSLLVIFELLLCAKMDGSMKPYGVVFTPVFLGMLLLMLRACHLHN